MMRACKYMYMYIYVRVYAWMCVCVVYWLCLMYYIIMFVMSSVTVGVLTVRGRGGRSCDGWRSNQTISSAWCGGMHPPPYWPHACWHRGFGRTAVILHPLLRGINRWPFRLAHSDSQVAEWPGLSAPELTSSFRKLDSTKERKKENKIYLHRSWVSVASGLPHLLISIPAK